LGEGAGGSGNSEWSDGNIMTLPLAKGFKLVHELISEMWLKSDFRSTPRGTKYNWYQKGLKYLDPSPGSFLYTP